nr:hypothetical protein GCM10025732_38910 [Glycomyces mayteni]
MTRSRSRLANESWESLLTAHAALMKRFAAEPIWDEVSMREYDVLYTLSKHEGRSACTSWAAASYSASPRCRGWSSGSPSAAWSSGRPTPRTGAACAWG